MIELEFLDEFDLSRRFFRMGTDPRTMLYPVEVDLYTESVIKAGGGR